MTTIFITAQVRRCTDRGTSSSPTPASVAATYRLVADPSLDGVTGRFFDRTREARANAQADDPDARLRLWNRSLELVGHSDAA